MPPAGDVPAPGAGGTDLDRMTVVAVSEHVSCDLEGECVILHLRTGVYYGLNAIGTRVWSLVQSPTTAAALRDALLAEYDVEPDACERDLMALLRELSERELVAITREPEAARPSRESSSEEAG